MRTMISALMVAAGIALASAPALAQNLRLLSSWDSSYAPVPSVLEPFVQRLNEASNGAINITRSGPETVPPFEQVDPVSRGLFDMLFTNGAYHGTISSVGMTLDAISASPDQVHQSGIWDYVDQHYREQHNLKLIAVLLDPNGFHIILRRPLGDDGLAGRRIRGTPIYHPLIEALGGAPVVLPAGEIYPSLERGVVDGAAWPTIGAVGFRWFEVADYMMRPTFGQVAHLVFMNLDRWEALPEETRTLITEVARGYEDEAVERFNGVVAEEETTLAREGMEVAELTGALREIVDRTWYEGAMKLAARTNPEEVARVDEMAVAAGLTSAK